MMDSHKGRGIPQSGVRYITQDLIKKVSKQDHLELITTLNLTLSKEGGKKFKYIENLDKLKKLQTLNLSCNIIEKIEKLDRLTKLRELSLAYNKITKIENLEALVNLQLLNLTGNQIEHIPVWVGKKLKQIRTLKLAKNELQSLQEFSKLRPLRDLSVLTVSENPVSLLPHCRLFLVFHLNTLETLDSQPVDTNERHTATERFGQEEIEKLTKQLEEAEAKYSQLQKGHNSSLNELEEREKAVKSKEQRLKQYQQTVKDLTQELDTKNDLLKRKTAELTKACEKHYELEQELAFYKIDHKFDALGKPRPLSTDEESLVDEDGLLGESPYIGKGRFKQNELAKQRALKQAKPSPVRYGHVGEPDKSGSGDGSYLSEQLQASIQTRQGQIEDLDRDIQAKQQAASLAQDELQQLQAELEKTSVQLNIASEELHKMNEAKASRHLTEDDKQHLRDRLAKKIDKMHDLREDTHRIEQAMQQQENLVHRQEQEIGRLRGHMRRLSSNDSLYHELVQEVQAKEHDLDLASQDYYDLQGQLEHMLATITKETNDMKRLETGLREGQVEENDALRTELEGVIEGLQSYLENVQGRANTQKEQFEELLRDREELLTRFQELEQQKETAEKQAHEITVLREKLADLEEDVAHERDLNDSLSRKLDESRLREQEDADISVQLHEAEDEIERLRRALAEADRRLKGERDTFNRTLEEEKKKTTQIKRRLKGVDAKDDEIATLQKQLGELQKSNIQFQDELWGLQQRLKEQQESAVDPHQLRRRLDDVVQGIRSGKSYVEPEHSEDEVGFVLRDLQDDVEKEIDKSLSEANKALKDREKAEAEVRRLRDAITQVQEDEQQRADRAINILDDQRREADELRAQLDRLRAELDREKQRSSQLRERPVPVQYLQPSTKASTSTTTTSTGTTVTSATSSSGSTEEESSTIPSSQWSRKRRELYDTFTPDEQALFDELQQEIDLLRKLLSKKDRKGAEKAIQAVEAKAQQLQELLDKRYSTTATSSGGAAPPRAGKKSPTKGHSKGGDHKRGSSGDRTAPSSAAAPSKKRVVDDPRLHAAIKELSQAQHEIDALQDELKEKNAVLRRELKKSDKKDGTVASQQTEIDRLHDILEEQRAEIGKLNQEVDRLGLQPADQYAGYEDQVQDFLQAAENLQSSLSQHRPRVARLGPGWRGAAPLGREGHPDPRDYPYTGAESRVPTDSLQVIPPTSPAPAGRPLPTFYDPQGHPIQHQYYPTATQVPPHLASQPQVHQQVPPQMAPPPQVAPPPQLAPQYPQPGTRPLPGVSGSFGAPVMGASGAGLSAGHPGTGQAAPGTAYSLQGVHSGGGQSQQGAALQTEGVSHTPGGQADDWGQAEQPIQGFMGPDGQLYVPAGQADDLDQSFLMTPQTKLRSLSTGDLHAQTGYSSTPLAGSMMNQLGSAPLTPNTSHLHPTLMSTPLTTRAGDTPTQVKGILKKAGVSRSASEECLVCNVPEHHDLEDYIEKLQNKIKRLKGKSRSRTEQTSHSDSKQVFFEDDVDKKTVRRLQAELETRRDELEGLDLAIERQKQQLQGMKESEKVLLAQREAAREELSQLKHGREGRRGHRKAYLDGKVKFDAYDSDYDYEYNPRSRSSRSQYLIQEIDCLEETLAKRRAELRAADKLLQETEMDLEAARREARSTIQEYDSAKQGIQSTMRDTSEIERRAHDAGVRLIKTEEHVVQVEEEFRQLRESRLQQEQLLKDIQKIISGKDDEFTKLQAKIAQSQQRLAEVQSELVYAESQQEQKLELLKESERVLADRKEEGEHLRRQEERELERLRSESSKLSTEMDKLRLDVLREKESLEGLGKQKKDLEAVIDRVNNEKGQVEEEAREVHRKLDQLNRAKNTLEETIGRNHSKLSCLDQEVRQIEQVLVDRGGQRSSLQRELQGLRTNIQGGRSELNSITGSLREAEGHVRELEQRESEFRGHTEDKFLTLEERVRNLARELSQKDRDKDELVSTLNRSYSEVQTLRKQLGAERREAQRRLHGTQLEADTLRQELDDRMKELKQFKDKAGKEVSDLEGIAQAHAGRANRLADELSYLRADYLEVKRQLDSQKQLAERDKELEDTIRELKKDLAFELRGGHSEGLQQEVLSELDAMYTEKQSLEDQVELVRNRLYQVRRAGVPSQPSTDQIDNLSEHQKLLKDQIQKRMSRQVEALNAHRQLSQSNIQNLQHKLSNLEQVLSLSEPRGVGASPVSDIISAAREKLQSLTPVKDSTGSSGHEVVTHRTEDAVEVSPCPTPEPESEFVGVAECVSTTEPPPEYADTLLSKYTTPTLLQESSSQSQTAPHSQSEPPTKPPTETPTPRQATPSRIPTRKHSRDRLPSPRASGPQLGSGDSGIMVDINQCSSEESTTESHIPRPRHAYSPNRRANRASRSRSDSRSRKESSLHSQSAMFRSDKSDSN